MFLKVVVADTTATTAAAAATDATIVLCHFHDVVLHVSLKRDTIEINWHDPLSDVNELSDN